MCVCSEEGLAWNKHQTTYCDVWTPCLTWSEQMKSLKAAWIDVKCVVSGDSNPFSAVLHHPSSCRPLLPFNFPSSKPLNHILVHSLIFISLYITLMVELFKCLIWFTVIKQQRWSINSNAHIMPQLIHRLLVMTPCPPRWAGNLFSTFLYCSTTYNILISSVQSDENKSSFRTVDIFRDKISRN